MRMATLITGLERVKVRCSSHAEYVPRHDMQMPFMATDGAMLEPFEELTVTTCIVPITRFCATGKPDLYIAYSQEVEQLLGIPISVILKEKDEAISSRNEAWRETMKLRNMTAWQHIKTACARLLAARKGGKK